MRRQTETWLWWRQRWPIFLMSHSDWLADFKGIHKYSSLQPVPAKGVFMMCWGRLLWLTFGEPVGLADGERIAPFWMRSRRGGTGGRPRCWTQRPESPPWAFLCWLTGEELGDTMGEFWRSAQCWVKNKVNRILKRDLDIYDQLLSLPTHRWQNSEWCNHPDYSSAGATRLCSIYDYTV